MAPRAGGRIADACGVIRYSGELRRAAADEPIEQGTRVWIARVERRPEGMTVVVHHTRPRSGAGRLFVLLSALLGTSPLTRYGLQARPRAGAWGAPAHEPYQHEGKGPDRHNQSTARTRLPIGFSGRVAGECHEHFCIASILSGCRAQTSAFHAAAHDGHTPSRLRLLSTRSGVPQSHQVRGGSRETTREGGQRSRTAWEKLTLGVAM